MESGLPFVRCNVATARVILAVMGAGLSSWSWKRCFVSGKRASWFTDSTCRVTDSFCGS